MSLPQQGPSQVQNHAHGRGNITGTVNNYYFKDVEQLKQLIIEGDVNNFHIGTNGRGESLPELSMTYECVESGLNSLRGGAPKPAEPVPTPEPAEPVPAPEPAKRNVPNRSPSPPPRQPPQSTSKQSFKGSAAGLKIPLPIQFEASNQGVENFGYVLGYKLPMFTFRPKFEFNSKNGTQVVVTYLLSPELTERKCCYSPCQKPDQEEYTQYAEIGCSCKASYHLLCIAHHMYSVDNCCPKCKKQIMVLQSTNN